MGAAHRDVLHLGKIPLPLAARSGENAVAEHKGAPRPHPVVLADPVHGLLHPENLRPVLQKQVPGLKGQLHDFFFFLLSHTLTFPLKNSS